MQSHRRAERPGARLARSYLAVRAEQCAERQPRRDRGALVASVRLPRLDTAHLSSPEAHAQLRLSVLARLATGSEPWFVLAARDDARAHG